MNKNCEVKTKKSGKLAMVLVTIFSAFTLMVMGIWAVANGRGVSFSLPITLDPLTFLKIEMQMDYNGDGDFEDEGEDGIYTIFDNTASGSVSWSYVSEGAISFAKNSPIKNVSNDTIYKLTFTNKSGEDTYLQITENYDDSFYNKPFTTYPQSGIINLGNNQEAYLLVHSNPVLTSGLYPLPLLVKQTEEVTAHTITLDQKYVSSPTPTSIVVTGDTSFKTTFTALNNYALPSQVKITQGATTLAKDIDYKWNQETGELNLFARSITADTKIKIVGVEQGWVNTNVADSYAGGEGTSSNPYQIDKPSQLAHLRSLVNGGANQENVYFELTTDINLNGSDDNQWTPIGNGISFKGVFNGNGNTIDGLYINKPESDFQGLFGWARESVIQNLVIGKYSTVSARYRAGGICGLGHGMIIINCENYGSISVSSDDVGGIIGAEWTGKIIDCKNFGNVYSSGISVGGIAGTCDSQMVRCENYGTIVAGGGESGGIVGEDYSDQFNCVNYGIVRGSGYVGGVGGRKAYYGGDAYGYGVQITINCANFGEVNNSGTATDYGVAGIIGVNTGGYAKSTGVINNCFNIGTVGGACPNQGSIVGLVNFEDYSHISNCYYLPGTNPYPVENANHSGCSEITSAQALCDSLNSNIKALAQEYVGVKIYYWTLVGSTNGWPILSDSYELVEA